MKKIISLLVPLLLFCLEAYSGYDYSASITKYVGETIVLNPMSDCNASCCYGTGIFYDTDAFHVEKIAETNSLGLQKVNGSTTGTYYTYKLTALQAGIYTVTCSVQYFESISGYKYQYNKATYTITVKEVPIVVSISIPSALTLFLGDVYSFSPIIYETGASTSLTWNSSNNSVASIDKNGLLTTKGVGTTTIFCTASNGVSAQCVVSVNPVLVSGITLNMAKATVATGKQLQLTATLAPSNASNKSVTWSSSNEAVAVVSENGTVIAISPGVCQIKATANDGSGKSASCMLTVKDKDEVSDFLIGSVNDWQEFAAIVLEQPDINARMTADIDLGDVQTVIGTEEVPYEGHFDGQGHTLTVHLNGTIIGLAPFLRLKNATIERLHVTGSIHTTAQAACGIAGACRDKEGDKGTTIRRCRVSAQLTTDDDSNGGFTTDGGYNMLVEDCLFDGAFAEKNNFCCGGFVNWSPYAATIRNGLNLGSFTTGKTYSCATFIRTASEGAGEAHHKLENLYYLNLYGLGQGTRITTDQLADGTVTAYLQAGREETVWVQDETTHRPMLAAFVAMDKCATPTITYENGQLMFGCETEDVDFISSIKDSDIRDDYKSPSIQLSVTYNVSVRATKAGYLNSDVTTATLCWIDVTPTGENIAVGHAEVRATPVLIDNSGGVLTVHGVTDGTSVSVYDIAGRMVGSATATGQATRIGTTLRNGDTCIVRIGDKAVKVMMR